MIAGVVMAAGLSACGGGGSQAASEPKGNFGVAVDAASFPAHQSLSQHAQLVIVVRNTGRKAIPDVAVTICNATCTYPAPNGEGTSAAAFGNSDAQPYLANPSRPLWIVDRAPGPCQYSCKNGGQGEGVTADANTWALGRLEPGQTVRFDWSVTAVAAGHHVLAWEVAAGLNGNAKAVVAGGSHPHGTFSVNVTQKPPQTYVNNNGQIVTGTTAGG
jgi:hypothetical protein